MIKKCKKCKKLSSCEIHKFLKYFIKYQYKKDILNMPFKCCDKDERNNPSPEIAFNIDGKSIAIEAKGLELDVIHNTKTYIDNMANSLMEVLRDKEKCIEMIGEEKSHLIVHACETFGIDIAFNEGILFLDFLAKDCRKDKNKEELLKQILCKVAQSIQSILDRKNKDNVMLPEMFTLDVNKFFPSKKFMSPQTKNNFKGYDYKYGELPPEINDRLKNRKMSEYESIWNKYSSETTKFKEAVEAHKAFINIGVSVVGHSGLYISSMCDKNALDDRKRLEEQYVRLYDQAVDKFNDLEYRDIDKNILFFNSELPYIEGMPLSVQDIVDTLIKIGRSAKYNIIDEVWGEFSEYADVSKSFDHAEIVSLNKRRYIKIKPIPPTNLTKN